MNAVEHRKSEATGQNAVGASVRVDDSNGSLHIWCKGSWTLSCITDADVQIQQIEQTILQGPQLETIVVDSAEAQEFDTSGAWLITRLQRAAEKMEVDFTHKDVDQRRTQLVNVVSQSNASRTLPDKSRGFGLISMIERLGRFTVGMWKDLLMIANMIGAAIRGPQMKAVKGRGLRLISVVHQLDQMALKAVPVIAVMSFLIGAIIAQQGAFQLKFFGEELLTVNLVGILLLREIGVLLTAVMMAGRTGSAITAEIGTMKMREEVDALRVIGLNPVGVLVVPRLLALIIAIPILTFLADIAGLAGAIVVSWLYVGISPEQFVTALREAIDLSTVFAGLIKAPFMAIVIALIAAIEGLKVSGSSESLGRHTTNAVVRSIFAVILLDGLFAIFYAAIDY